MKAKAKIQLRDGSEVEVDCYMHPDPVVEAWRRHKHISPVIQMIGRARPYNRTKENPLVIYVLLNEPLGIPVDQVLDWNKDELEPMALVDPMGCDGWVALSPEVMCALWPTVFKSRRTAERELQELRGSGKRAKDILAILANGRWQRASRSRSREHARSPVKVTMTKAGLRMRRLSVVGWKRSPAPVSSLGRAEGCRTPLLESWRVVDQRGGSQTAMSLIVIYH